MSKTEVQDIPTALATFLKLELGFFTSFFFTFHVTRLLVSNCFRPLPLLRLTQSPTSLNFWILVLMNLFKVPGLISLMSIWFSSDLMKFFTLEVFAPGYFLKNSPISCFNFDLDKKICNSGSCCDCCLQNILEKCRQWSFPVTVWELNVPRSCSYCSSLNPHLLEIKC